jgi:hypothetical protein
MECAGTGHAGNSLSNGSSTKVDAGAAVCVFTEGMAEIGRWAMRTRPIGLVEANMHQSTLRAIARMESCRRSYQRKRFDSVRLT